MSSDPRTGDPLSQPQETDVETVEVDPELLEWKGRAEKAEAEVRAMKAGLSKAHDAAVSATRVFENVFRGRRA